MKLLSVAEAQERLVEKGRLMATEGLPIENAAGRILSEDVAALITQPPFNASAMDGYAVLSTDCTKLPISLEVIGESSAGHPFEGDLRPGTAVRIFTGAALPSSGDAIAIQEDCERLDEQTVLIKEVASNGQFIRPAGYDFHEGDVLLSKGTCLNFRDLTLLASMNIPEVTVYKKPRVAIIATGDELVSPGEDLGNGQIISSIPYGMVQLFENAGAQATCLGIAKDSMASLDHYIQEAISQEQNFDIVVTIGGASVGDHDLVQAALKNAGMALDFWKIAMRPGKPLMVGSLADKSVIGVPGNPVSALICAEIFVVPLIRSMMALDPTFKPHQKARLQNQVPSNGPRQHYLRALQWMNEEGQQCVSSLEDQDSSLQATFSKASCLIVRVPHAESAQQGDLVDIYPLD